MREAKSDMRHDNRALYRKYRSRNFSEVIGQEHITKTLESAIKQRRVSHAYLFTGPRGVGKTSVARILAHRVNELPYEDESNALDIIEIDGASNRGIDEIRELREKAFISPTSAKYKVYIIDEVHMLTQPAFNALLKILEEPPAHVIFILATTEAHKLPATIISRTQRHSFLPISEHRIIKHLEYIAEQEHIDISSSALKLIARHGDGSLRDSISLLDQVSGGTKRKISEAYVRTMLGLVRQEVLDELIDATLNGKTDQILDLLDSMLAQGATAAIISRQLLDQLRQRIASDQSAMSEILLLIDELMNVPGAFDRDLKLRTTLLRQASHNLNTTLELAKTNFKAPAKPSQPATADLEKPEVAQSAETPKESTAKLSPLNRDSWNNILKTIKSSNNSLYAILRMAHPEKDDRGVVVLSFGFPFHKGRVDENRNKHLIEQVLTKHLGATTLIRTRLDRTLATPKIKEPLETTDTALESIISTMGGGEVIEV